MEHIEIEMEHHAIRRLGGEDVRGEHAAGGYPWLTGIDAVGVFSPGSLAAAMGGHVYPSLGHVYGHGETPWLGWSDG